MIVVNNQWEGSISIGIQGMRLEVIHRCHGYLMRLAIGSVNDVDIVSLGALNHIFVSDNSISSDLQSLHPNEISMASLPDKLELFYHYIG
jgi:hypothetical protein